MDVLIEELKTLIGTAMPQLDVSCVTAETRLKQDLGLDSLGTMMIALLLEDAYGFRFEGAIEFDTVGELCAYIQAHTKPAD